MAPEPVKEYIDQKQRDIREAARNPQNAEEILLSISEPVTAENILAVNVMTGGMGPGYKKMFSQDKSSDDDRRETEREALTEEDARELAEKMGER